VTPLVLTHSDIQNFLRCRRLFKFSVVDDWSLPEPDTSALSLGTRVHAAVELFHRDGLDPVDAHTAMAQDARARTENAPQFIKDQLEVDILVGTNCAMAYRRWLFNEDPYKNWEIIGIERAVETPMLGGKVILRGKIDLLLKGTGPNDGQIMLDDLKGLSLDTPIPTPDGWTTMGAVREGDTVFDMDGKPCRVTAKSAAKQIGTYIVKFNDGSEVVCDPEHYWMVRSGHPVPGKGIGEIPLVARSIEEIRKTLIRGGQKHHRVPVAGPLDLPEADLPVDPYLLGCWLGDGHAYSGNITKSDSFFDHLERQGYALNMRKPDKRRPHVVACSPVGLTAALNAAGLLQNKHIPDIYLRGSYQQRLALLRGLMDTDGTWNQRRGTCVMTGTDKALMMQVHALMVTLGLKPHLGPHRAEGFGLVVEAYPVEISATTLIPFLWPDKADRVTGASDMRVNVSARRVIVSVEPGPDVPTACISVDSPSHTYLCGENMIPTHNTVATTRVDAAQNYVLRSYQHAVYAHTLEAQDKIAVTKARYVHLKKVRDLSRTPEPVIVTNVPVLRRTTATSMAYIERILVEMEALIRKNQPETWYPYPQDACGWCPYRNPCLLATEGRGAENRALADKFVHGQRLARYNA